MAGRKERKGTKGAAVEYVSRGRAMRKLQLERADFRRLCILKGVHPRDAPHKNRIAGATRDPTGVYLAKDVRHMAHDPVLAQLRSARAFDKRVRRLLGRGDVSRAVEAERTLRPALSLARLVKERYPTFADALRDMDDALSLVALFAALPSGAGESAAADPEDDAAARDADATPEACARLLREFEAAVVGLGALRRAFASVKGMYFQADVLGAPVTWVVPHAHVGVALPGDADARLGEPVDWAAMRTFLAFHAVHVRAVNARLFARLGWAYPPAAGSDIHEGLVLSRASLPAVSSIDIQAEGPLAGQRVFVSREAPLRAVSLVASALGAAAVVCEDPATLDPAVEADASISLHVVDRPRLPRLFPGRAYVQPQYVLDVLNAHTAWRAENPAAGADAFPGLDAADYRVGAALPPHVSPFVSAADLAPAPGEDSDDGAEGAAAAQKERALALLSKKKQKLYARRAADEADAAQEKKRMRAVRASAAKKA